MIELISISELIVRILREIRNLNDRERKVIVLRFGLDEGKGKTLEEVGKLFGVTRERIRQVESRTLKKIEKAIRERIAQIEEAIKE